MRRPLGTKTSIIDSAVKYPFMKQNGVLSDPESINHAYDNNSYISFLDSAGTHEVEALRVNTSNGVMVGNTLFNRNPIIVPLELSANASITDQVVWIAPFACEVFAAYEIHATAASAGTVQLVKCTSGQAITSGTSLLTTAFDLTSTANTQQAGSLVTDRTKLQLAAGDRLALDFTGSLTSLAGLLVEVVLFPGNIGNFAVFQQNANAGLVDQAFFTAQKAERITAVYYVHSTAGTDASPVWVQVTKDTGTTAPGAGTDLLTNNSNSGFDCKGTANVVQTGSLTATTSALYMNPGDRLSVDFAGTTTSLAGVVIVVVFSPSFTTKMVTFNSQAAAGSLTEECFFIADRPYRILSISEVHSTAGTDVGSVNLQITRDRLTDAPGSGLDLLTNNTNAGFNLKGTANTVQTATFAEATPVLVADDRLSVDPAGTLTSLAGVQVTVLLQQI